jgi:hypothetical protein
MRCLPSIRRAGRVAAITTLLLGISGAAQAADWYFYVQNNSRATLTRLQVKEKGGPWGAFDLGGGIASGQKSRIDWGANTNNQACNQIIRASFSDGSMSKELVVDFCKDLDTPIVFGD